MFLSSGTPLLGLFIFVFLRNTNSEIIKCILVDYYLVNSIICSGSEKSKPGSPSGGIFFPLVYSK